MVNKKRITRRSALGLLAVGGFGLGAETFGFSEVTGTRGANVSTTSDPGALLGIVGLLNGDAVDGDNVEIIELINQTDEQLDLDVDQSVGSGLSVADPFEDGPLAPGESTTLSVSCDGGAGSGFTTVGLNVNSAVGESIRIEQLSRTFSIERDCPGGGAGPFFEIQSMETNAPIDEDEALDVEADIVNTGLDPDTQDIELDIDGTVVDTEPDLTLDGGQSETVNLSWPEEDTAEGIYEATLSSDDDSASEVVEVGVDDGFTYEIHNISATDGGGNTIEITVELTTDDPDAVLEIRTLRGEEERGSVEIENPGDTETRELDGRRQADEIEANLYDGDGNRRDTESIPW